MSPADGCARVRGSALGAVGSSNHHAVGRLVRARSSGGCSLQLRVVCGRRARHLIARGPDALFYPMNYYPIRYLNNVIRIPEDRPDSTQWYHFRLMRRDGVITVLLNRQRLRNGPDYNILGDVPIMVWHDRGERAGPVLDGGLFCFRQQGRGYWRDIRVWSCR